MGVFRLPGNQQMVQGIPIGKLNNLDQRVTALEHGSGGSSPLTTKGDIYTYSTTNDRLPVGANGTVLSSDSTQATGLKWIAVSGTGTVTSVTSADANATVATTTTTPVITIVSAPKWATARNLAGNSVDGSANVAFANKFIVQGTTDTGLSGAQFLGALGTGIVKNTTTTGVLSIAIAADFPTLNQNTTGSAATLTTPRAINGVNFDGSAAITVTAAAGTLTGTTLNSTVVSSSLTSVGTIGTGTWQGTAIADTYIASATTWNGKQNAITLTTTGTSGAATFVSNTLNIPQYAGSTYTGTTNRITVTGTVIDIAATYVGQTSITTLGTITSGTWTGTTIAIANGGTGQTSKATAFDALSPMTTSGDIIYGGASGTGTRLAKGSDGQVLTLASGLPTWAPSSGGSGLIVGTTTIASGTTTRILYDNAGVLGEYTISGTGTVVAMQTSPAFTTPSLGVATYTTLVGGNITDSGLTAGRVTFAGTSGILSDDAKLLWDNTNKFLGVGAAPQSVFLAAGQTTIQTPISGTTAQFVGVDAAPLRITYDTHNNASSSGTAFMFRRSRGTAGTPSAVQSGDVLASLNARGYGVSQYAAASTGVLSWKANQTFTNTANGTYLSIDTTPDGSVTAAEVARFTATNLTLGVAGTMLGSLVMSGNTSGAITIQGVAAGGSSVNTLQAVTDTFVYKATTDTLTNKTISGSTNIIGGVTLTLGSDASFDTYYRSAGGVLTRLANGTTGQFLGANTGAAPTWQSPSAGLTIGSSAISGGTTTRILYDNAGVLGEYTITGTGTVVAMQTSPSFTTPTLGVATGTRLGIGVAADASRLLLVQGDVAGGIATLERTNTSTTGALGTAIIKATSTGDMTDGFGAAFQFAIQDNAAVENLIANIQGTRNGADNSGSLNFTTVLAGASTVNYSIKARGDHVFSNPVVTSGLAPQWNFNPGAHTGLTASTESADVVFALNRTVQFATGALTTQRAFAINAPTYAFVGASTITNAATFYVASAPAAGTNATITNAYSMWVASGTVRVDASIGTTANRVTKLWTTDLEVTNAPTLSGVAIPSISSTSTLTNKRITPRTGTVTSSATPSINTDNVDFYSITALAANITSMTSGLSGTPTDAQTLWISFLDNGTARTIAWGTSFEASTVALPTTTVLSTRLDVRFVWNAATSKWRCVGTA